MLVNQNAAAVQHPISQFLTLTGAFQSVYAVNTYRWFTVKNIHLDNTSANPVTVQVCFVFKGASPIQGNSALWGFSIPANDFIEWGEGQRLPPGASVQALASTGGVINMWVSGIEEPLF